MGNLVYEELIFLGTNLVSMSTQNDYSAVFRPPPYEPFNASYKVWTQRWWKWIMSIPSSISPVFDNTGSKYSYNQNDPNVRFLAGTLGGIAERECAIRHGMSIFFPVINVEASFKDSALSTERELILFTKDQIDDIDLTSLEVLLNDKPIGNLSVFRVSTHPFDIEFTDNNILKADAGKTKLASDGYWIFLRPLRAGAHTLSFSGSCLSGRIHIGCRYSLTVF